MTYSTSNPPALALQTLGYKDGGRTWKFTGTDAVATVQVDGYISNAEDLGMKVGDLVEYYDSNLKITSTLVVDAINANGSADLADPTTIGSTTDSD